MAENVVGTHNGSGHNPSPFSSHLDTSNGADLPVNLASCLLLPALNLDPRPTFILDLRSNTQIPCICFTNAALDALPVLCKAIRRSQVITDCPSSHKIQHGGRQWDHYTIASRWAVFSTANQQMDEVVQPDGPDMPRKRQRRSPDSERHSVNCQQTPLRERLWHGSNNMSILAEGCVPLRSLRNMPKEQKDFVDSFQWEATDLGPTELWPARLYELFLTLLFDPRPASMTWGQDCILLYNKACLPLMGQLHPMVMGNLSRKACPDGLYEAAIKPLNDEIYSTRRYSLRTNHVSFVRDGNFLQESSYEVTSQPLFDDKMEMIGIYHTQMEITRQLKEARRTKTLAALSALVNQGQRLKNTWECILEQLSDNEDLPQMLLYSLSSGDEDAEKLECKLEGNIQCKQSVGLEKFLLYDPDHPVAALFRHSLTMKLPLYLSQRRGYTSTDLWLQPGHAECLQHLSALLPGLLSDFELSPSGHACDSVVVFPIKLTNSQKVRGFVVFGLHTLHPYDESYRSYILLLEQTISTVITSEILWREGDLLSKKAESVQADLSAKLLRQTEETMAIESRFSHLARVAPIGICITRADGAMAFANKKWYSLTGCSEDSDRTNPSWWSSLIVPEDLPMMQSFFQKVQNGSTETVEFRLAVPSKQYPSPVTWILASGYPEFRKDNELDSLIACLTEITEQKGRTEEAIQARKQQENFIDVTSHEIRNPLSVSLQCSEEISNIATSVVQNAGATSRVVTVALSEIQDVLNAAEVIQQSTNHQKRIVDDILTLSKMEAGVLPFNLSPCRPYLIAENTFKMFRRESVHSGTKVTIVKDDSFSLILRDDEWVELDQGRLGQMMINLMTNAIKFTKSQAIRKIEIKVGASTDSSTLPFGNIKYLEPLDHERVAIGSDWDDNECVFVHFSVSDSGTGISEEDQGTIFGRFSQGSPKTYTEHGGSGLGLYICRALVEIHGGQIGLHSVLGVGSKFAFCIKTRRLPHRPSDLSPTAVRVKSTPRSGKDEYFSPADATILTTADLNVQIPDKLYIMIVEDNPINQKVLGKQLRKDGHIIVEANHGQACLDLLAETEFCNAEGWKLSVILMDIEMPVMNGIDCTKEIRRRQLEGTIKGHIPIISTTGNARSEKLEKVRAAGVDDIILKPYSVPDLLEMIGEVISKTTKAREAIISP